jgi:hypothetical protein
MAKPVLTGQSKRLSRRPGGEMNSIDLIPVVEPPVGDYPAFHEFTGLPQTADGWTDLDSMIMGAGYEDAQIVYVSSSTGTPFGSVYSRDSSIIGGTPTNPKGQPVAFATAAQARVWMRNGKPDVMLFKRGDTFDHTQAANYIFSSNAATPYSGASKSARQIYAAYGPVETPRPIFQIASTGQTQILCQQNSGGSFLVFAHLAFIAADWVLGNEPKGVFYFIGHVYRDVLAEGIYAQRLNGGFMAVNGFTLGYATNFAFRRNCVFDTYANPWWWEKVDGLWIEENISDYVGIRWRLAGNTSGVAPQQFYIQTNNLRATVKNNLLSRGESSAVQLRAGGVCEGNLILLHATGISGLRDDAPPNSVAFRRNLVLESTDQGAGARCKGISQDSSVPSGFSLEMSENIICYITGSYANSHGILIGGNQYDGEISRNVVWEYPRNSFWALHETGQTKSGVTISDNLFHTYGAGLQNGSNCIQASSKMTPQTSPVMRGNTYRAEGLNVSLNGFAVFNSSGGSYASFQTYVNSAEEILASSSDGLWDESVGVTPEFDNYVIGELGLADRNAWYEAIRLQRLGNWDVALTPQSTYEWYATGFGLN